MNSNKKKIPYFQDYEVLLGGFNYSEGLTTGNVSGPVHFLMQVKITIHLQNKKKYSKNLFCERKSKIHQLKKKIHILARKSYERV